jgi:hypothetical protein
VTQPKPNAHTQHKSVKASEEQRLTDKLSEAVKFSDLDHAAMAATLVHTFKVLTLPVVPTQIGSNWYLVWSLGDDSLFVCDPDI